MVQYFFLSCIYVFDKTHKHEIRKFRVMFYSSILFDYQRPCQGENRGNAPPPPKPGKFAKDDKQPTFQPAMRNGSRKTIQIFVKFFQKLFKLCYILTKTIENFLNFLENFWKSLEKCFNFCANFI